MFTGIVSEVGSVRRFDRSGSAARLEIVGVEVATGLKICDSVSVNGVCLTVVAVSKPVMAFDVMGETVLRCSFDRLVTGSRVNLESALRMGDHLGGHIVQGHVDCAGVVERIEKRRDDVAMTVAIDRKDAHLVVEKGSVAIDGISLTVGAVTDRSFAVHLIPHTLSITNLGDRVCGDTVNVEFDIVGKYIARSRELTKSGSGVSEELLRRARFI